MNEPRVVESIANECQSLGRAHESSSARAEQLIACLEGEIAKRDARIVELKQYEYAFNEWLNKTEWVQEESASFSAKYLGLHRADIMRDIIYQLLAELTSLKAQEPVAWEVYYADDDSFHTITRNKMLIDGYSSMAYVIKPLYAAPSPAGVDGCKCSMSISMLGDGCRHCQPQEYIDRLGEMLDEERSELSDAQAIIDGLRGEVERLQMQLAACGVVALANTIESAGEARQMHPDYMSASCSDVADAVDREIALRTERDQLAGLLREVHDTYRAAIHWEDLRATMKRIDAAIN